MTSDAVTESMDEFRDEYWTELLRQFDRLLALHKNVEMDTERDRLIHAEAVALLERAAAHYRIAIDPSAGLTPITPKENTEHG